MSQIRLKVSELQNTINAAQNELYRLQAECPHPSYHAAMYMWRAGAFNPSRICDDCGASLPGITEEESNTVYENWGITSSGTVTIIQGDENSPSLSIFTTTSGGS